MTYQATISSVGPISIGVGLDNKRSKVSPALEKEQQKPTQRAVKRGVLRRLRMTAGQLLPKENVSRCGLYCQTRQGEYATIRVDDHGASYGNVIRCGSVWMCPDCAAKIAAGRREEVEAVVTAHRAAGGKVAMASLTIPHDRFQSAKELRVAVAEAWKRVIQGKMWIKARDAAKFAGFVRSLEVTHGKAGWHPHIHALIFFDTTDPALIAAFRETLFKRWQAAIEKLGYGEASRAAFDFRAVTEDCRAADYVTKGAAAFELTYGHLKQAKGGNRTPMQILADYEADGSPADARLYVDYALAFKGARQLTWSRGLRDRYGEQASDEELADAKTGEVIARIDQYAFDKLRERRELGELLAWAEKDGFLGVVNYLGCRGLAWACKPPPIGGL